MNKSEVSKIIKPLNWYEHKRDDIERWSVETVFSSYIITKIDSEYDIYFGFWGSAAFPKLENTLSLEEAKKSCQNHHIDLILNLIVEHDDYKIVPSSRKGFPILGEGTKIDWQLVEEHGKQAHTNHYQTIEDLARRGGLSWCEMYAVLHNKRWEKMDQNEAMIACRKMEAEYLKGVL